MSMVLSRLEAFGLYNERGARWNAITEEALTELPNRDFPEETTAFLRAAQDNDFFLYADQGNTPDLHIILAPHNKQGFADTVMERMAKILDKVYPASGTLFDFVAASLEEGHDRVWPSDLAKAIMPILHQRSGTILRIADTSERLQEVYARLCAATFERLAENTANHEVNNVELEYTNLEQFRLEMQENRDILQRTRPYRTLDTFLSDISRAVEPDAYTALQGEFTHFEMQAQVTRIKKIADLLVANRETGIVLADLDDACNPVFFEELDKTKKEYVVVAPRYNPKTTSSVIMTRLTGRDWLKLQKHVSTIETIIGAFATRLGSEGEAHVYAAAGTETTQGKRYTEAHECRIKYQTDAGQDIFVTVFNAREARGNDNAYITVRIPVTMVNERNQVAKYMHGI
jgi:hypothetical protein